MYTYINVILIFVVNRLIKKKKQKIKIYNFVYYKMHSTLCQIMKSVSKHVYYIYSYSRDNKFDDLL